MHMTRKLIDNPTAVGTLLRTVARYNREGITPTIAQLANGQSARKRDGARRALALALITEGALTNANPKAQGTLKLRITPEGCRRAGAKMPAMIRGAQ